MKKSGHRSTQMDAVPATRQERAGQSCSRLANRVNPQAPGENAIQLDVVHHPDPPLGTVLYDAGIQQVRISRTKRVGPAGDRRVHDQIVVRIVRNDSIEANLLHSPHMKALMAYLPRNFDRLLIDTPPMLQMPDARVVARVADAQIMVMRAGVTTRDAALAATKRFSDDHVELLGVILNDWKSEKFAERVLRILRWEKG